MICKELCVEMGLHLSQSESHRKEVLWSDIHPNVSIEDIIIEPIQTASLEYIDYEWVSNNIDMTEKQLEYLYLYYWEGYTYEAIAKQFGVSKQSVYKIVVKAKNKLYRGLTSPL